MVKMPLEVLRESNRRRLEPAKGNPLDFLRMINAENKRRASTSAVLLKK